MLSVESLMNNICKTLKKDNVIVFGIELGDVEGELLHETKIYIKTQEFNKWNYFMQKVNEEYQICWMDQSETSITIGFYALNEPIENKVLLKDLKQFYDCVKRKHYLRERPSMECWSVLVKPTHRCNLDCKYCYDRPFRQDIQQDMDMETFDKIMELCSYYTENLQLIWHGGEPTLVGSEWYEQAQKIIQKYPMMKVEQSIMSNGLNYNKEWADLFKKYNISPGMSYDAIVQSHVRGHGKNEDRQLYKYSEQHKISQEDRDISCVNLEHTLKYFKRRGFGIGTINLISSHNHDKLIETYEHLKKLNIGTCFNTAFQCKGATESNISPEIEKYRRNYEEYFRHWLYDTKGIRERSAFETLSQIIGTNEVTCAFNDCRYNWLGFNPIGDIYPCDRWFPEKYKMGNIFGYNSISEIYNSEKYQNFAHEVQQRFKNYCSYCGYWQMCKGGCNANPADHHGTVAEREEAECAALQARIKAAYHVLRNVDIINDDLNPCAKKMMIESCFYSIAEIKKYMQEARVKIDMHYDPEDLINCSEYQIFRAINPFREIHKYSTHIDFINSKTSENIEYNEQQRKNAFWGILKQIRREGAPEVNPAPREKRALV